MMLFILRRPSQSRSSLRASTYFVGYNTFHEQRRGLRLAFDLHEPENSRLDPKQRPILFLHGLFGSKRNNRAISRALARDLGAPIYALDLRNHGDSPHAALHNYTSMAADVDEFMHSHNITEATLIGHSMGAKTAMVAALTWPEKFGALVPVDNAPVDVPLQSAFARYVQGMRQVSMAQVRSLSSADKIMEEFEQNISIRQFLLTNLIRDRESGIYHWRIPVERLGAALGHMGDFPIRDSQTARFNGPTLIVRGTQSQYVPDEVLPSVGEFFPRFEVTDIDCGHWVISERPEEFRRTIVEFLKPLE